MTKRAELVKMRVEDKNSLGRLRLSLDAAKASLRLDECGDWRINGHRGWIYANQDSWLIYAAFSTSTRWNNAKRKLSFCDVTQDGDDEGYLRLSALPSDDRAKLIREVVGIRRAGKTPTPEQFRQTSAQ